MPVVRFSAPTQNTPVVQQSALIFVMISAYSSVTQRQQEAIDEKSMKRYWFYLRFCITSPRKMRIKAENQSQSQQSLDWPSFKASNLACEILRNIGSLATEAIRTNVHNWSELDQNFPSQNFNFATKNLTVVLRKFCREQNCSKQFQHLRFWVGKMGQRVFCDKCAAADRLWIFHCDVTQTYSLALSPT